MKKTLIAAGIAAVVAAPAAFADSTVYGKLHYSIDDTSRQVSNVDTDNLAINNNANRIGLKGSEDLGNGMTAVYNVEIQLNSGENADEFANTDTMSARNTFVGLKGSFGTVVVGSHDTPLKMSTGSLDFFGDTTADNNSAYTEDLSDRRADSTIAYITPTVNGVHAAIAFVPGEEDSTVANAADSINDAYSAAIIYSNGPFYASYAIEKADKNINALGSATHDLDQSRLGLGYTMGDLKLALVREEENSLSTNKDETRTMLAAKYTMGANSIAAKYFNVDDDDAAGSTNNGHDGYSVMVNHAFSKRTNVYAVYTDTSEDNAAASLDYSALSLGLSHSF